MCGHRPCLMTEAKRPFLRIPQAQVGLSPALRRCLQRAEQVPQAWAKRGLRRCALMMWHTGFCVFVPSCGEEVLTPAATILFAFTRPHYTAATLLSSACKPKICRQESGCLQGSRGTPRQTRQDPVAKRVSRDVTLRACRKAQQPYNDAVPIISSQTVEIALPAAVEQWYPAAQSSHHRVVAGFLPGSVMALLVHGKPQLLGKVTSPRHRFYHQKHGPWILSTAEDIYSDHPAQEFTAASALANGVPASAKSFWLSIARKT